MPGGGSPVNISKHIKELIQGFPLPSGNGKRFWMKKRVVDEDARCSKQ
jgi:hypothetical protein